VWTTAGVPAVRIAAVIIVGVVFALLGNAYGYMRAGIGVVMFVALAYAGIRWVQSAVSFRPDPEPTDVSDLGLKYVCRMCGLELKVEVAAKDAAPRHCMEPMELVRAGGAPPLHSI
jgi:hypothetical protein